MLQTIIMVIVIGGIFTLILGGVGVFLLSRYRSAVHVADESKIWPGVPGKVTFSDIITITPSREVDSTRSKSFEPSVEYTYTVQGMEYRGKHIGFTGGGSFSGTHSFAARAIKPYPVGSTPMVYYDPHNPSEAVLERKVQSRVGFLIAIIIFFLLGIASCGGSIWVVINSLSGS